MCATNQTYAMKNGQEIYFNPIMTKYIIPFENKMFPLKRTRGQNEEKKTREKSVRIFRLPDP